MSFRPAWNLIEKVLALARPIDRRPTVTWVYSEGRMPLLFFNDQGRLCHTQRFAVLRSVKNDIIHFFGAESTVALLAKDPANGIDNIRLAAAVRSDNGGDAGVKT